MAGCLSFGVALWIVVERNFYTNIFGSSLLEAAAYMQTVSGGMAIVFSIIGCIGGACKSRIVIQIVSSAGTLILYTMVLLFYLLYLYCLL